MEIACPKCGSTQITANKKGFSGVKAVGGAILIGGAGLLAGTLGSNKVVITCLACGKKFKPGEGKMIKPNYPSATNSVDSLPQKKEEDGPPKENRIICSECQTENLVSHPYCRNCKREFTDNDQKIHSTENILLYPCPNCKKLTPREGKFCSRCKLPNEYKNKSEGNMGCAIAVWIAIAAAIILCIAYC